MVSLINRGNDNNRHKKYWKKRNGLARTDAIKIIESFAYLQILRIVIFLPRLDRRWRFSMVRFMNGILDAARNHGANLARIIRRGSRRR